MRVALLRLMRVSYGKFDENRAVHFMRTCLFDEDCTAWFHEDHGACFEV